MDASESATVLIVEDDPRVRDLFAHILDADYDVRTASDETVFDEMDDDVDALLLDRRMPTRSGGEVLSALRDRGYDCPVGIVSAVEPDVDVVDMPFDDYLVKPVSSADLRDTVETLLLRRTYDDLVREYFALATKLSAIDDATARADRAERAEYAALRDRLERIEAECREAIDDLLSRECGEFLESPPVD